MNFLNLFLIEVILGYILWNSSLANYLWTFKYLVWLNPNKIYLYHKSNEFFIYSYSKNKLNYQLRSETFFESNDVFIKLIIIWQYCPVDPSDRLTSQTDIFWYRSVKFKTLNSLKKKNLNVFLFSDHKKLTLLEYYDCRYGSESK